GLTITTNYVESSVPFNQHGCLITRGSADKLNHFEVRMSQTHVEIYATDAGGGPLKLLADADLAMPFTRGVLWLEDLHYNGGKFDGQGDHTSVWDNVGFDGPALYRDLTFDVPDAMVPNSTGVQLGYRIDTTPRAVTAPGVNWIQTPTTAYVAFNVYAADT